MQSMYCQTAAPTALLASENVPVSIEVFNSWGTSLQKVSGLLAAQEIPIEAQSLPVGIYWVKATSKGVSDVQKLVIVH